MNFTPALRRHDLQEAKLFLKFAACFLFPLHQVKQVVVPTHQIIGEDFNRQIQTGFIVRVSGIDEMLWHAAQILSFVSQPADLAPPRIRR